MHATLKPIAQRSAKELRWLATHRCEHKHTYLEHYSCYCEREQLPVGFLDIETSDLRADFGIILSYSIKVQGQKKIYSSVITTEELFSKDEDKAITERLIRDMMKFSGVVTWYGRKFDIPYIRTRALAHNLSFPEFGAIKHWDIYYIAKFKLKLSSNRLDNVMRMVLGQSNKTHVDGKYWRSAQRGNKIALRYILDHNIKDVIGLEMVYDKLHTFSKFSEASI